MPADPNDVDSPTAQVVSSATQEESPSARGGDEAMAGWDDDWQRGDRLGDYELVAKLGEGGMARVYEARHVMLGRRVAIKTLRPEYRDHAGVRQRFARESQALALLKHQHVVDVITVGEHRGAPYLVMEFLTGEDLERRIAARGAMAVEEALAVVIPVCAAVQTAHDRGLIHRDLKPSNVMIEHGQDGLERPVVVDFGIARVEDGAAGRNTGSDALLGTPAYMAPEQTVGARDVGAAADQYALGVIAYECLAGGVAFEGETVYAILGAVARGQCVALAERRAGLPAGLVAAVARAMSVTAAARFASVREFGAALLPFADGATQGRWAAFFGGKVARPSQEPAGAVVGAAAAAPKREGTIEGSSREIDTPRVRERGTGRWRVAAAFVALAAVSAGAGAWMGRPKALGPYAVRVRTEPAAARIAVDGRAVASGAWAGAFAADGRVHRIRVEAEGYAAEDVQFVNAAPPEVIRLRQRRPAAGSAVVGSAVVGSAVAGSVVGDAGVASAVVDAGAGARVRHGARPARRPRRDGCVGPNGENFCL